ncbi:MAG: T9SS type A sorting domain-containing protein, partial [Saprospiraceae bacterium]
MICILGLTIPSPNLFNPRRSPVPPIQKVAHSIHCSGCHGFDESGKALVDGTGKDVNIFDDWQFSMMGLSAHDPFWRATIAHEVSNYPSAAPEIESTCLKCHAPLGNIQAHLTGHPYSYALMLQDSLGLDGVSCSSCHQQPAKDLGKGNSGNFSIDTNRVMFGPYPNPFQGPMQTYVGFSPVFSDHIYSSGVCAGCHTLITKTLNDDGSASGDFFVEQATYHEWLNSIYPAQGKECQTCHMPFIHDSVVVATDFKSLKKRYPFGLHQFFGANTAMLSMMKNNRDSLHLLASSPDRVWDESIQNNRISISKAATLTISSIQVIDDTLNFTVTVKNKTGHKFPSGYPSRLAWIQILLTDRSSSDTIYTNGVLDQNGNITGRDHPYEPHHQVSKSANDVQIYEMAMSDLHGDLTTRLNAAFKPLKDNRLLPLGFKLNSAVYDTVAIWGEAKDDADYGTGSSAGTDNIVYKVSLDGKKGFANLTVSFLYHALPARWMNDLFSEDSLHQVSQFKSMYQNYKTYTEIVDTAMILNIALSTTRSNDEFVFSDIRLFPNPGDGNNIRIKYPSSIANIHSVRIDIFDTAGHFIQAINASEKIQLENTLPAGVYYFLFTQESKVVAVKSYTVL